MKEKPNKMPLWMKLTAIFLAIAMPSFFWLVKSAQTEQVIIDDTPANNQQNTN